MTAIRTRILWLLMRLVSYERLARWNVRGRLRVLDPLLRRGDVQILGGMGVQMRLSAATFSPWGNQSYGVLEGSHEIQVQEALRRWVAEGDVVWDVGANIGMMSLIAARIVGPGGRVVAVEPEPECAAAIAENAARNDIDWIDVAPVAAVAQSGDVELLVVRDRLWTRLSSVGGHSQGEQRLTVRGVALDDLDAPAPTLVKIDVEGAELEVIAGMTRLLRDVKPVVVCEMHGKNTEFCDAMHAAGYVVANLDGPEPIPEASGNAQAICVPADARMPA